MKKIMIIAATALLAVGCGSSTKYTLSGSMTDVTGSIEVLDPASGDVLASATTEDGSFSLSGEVETPMQAYLGVDGQPVLAFFLEAGKLNVIEDEGMVIVKGTPANDAAAEVSAKQRVIEEKFYDENTTDEEKEALLEEYDAIEAAALDENLDNLYGLSLLQNASYGMTGDEIIAAYEKLAPELQEMKSAKALRERADVLKETEPGKPYKEIKQATPEGGEAALSEVIAKNKYVLLDFWASWCGPCMGEVPYMLEAYAEYKDKGFEIFGVSLDRSEEDWKECIKENKLDWVHVSTVTYWDNAAAKEYGVNSIPTNYLIDGNGTIVAKNLRGEDLAAKLAELLD